MLDRLCTGLFCHALLSCLSRLSEKDIKLAFIKEAALIFQYTTPATVDHLVETGLSLIQKITVDAINSGDI